MEFETLWTIAGERGNPLISSMPRLLAGWIGMDWFGKFNEIPGQVFKFLERGTLVEMGAFGTDC
jgi:hypothetical protein